MPTENLTGETAAAIIKPPTTAAPRRAQRLVPVAPRPRKRPATAVLVPTGPPARPAAPVSAVESKVTALQDPEEILRVIRTEAALRRAQRLSGQGEAQRQTIRLLSIGMLFALLAAAIGAMWYLQTSLQGSRRAHRVPAAVSVHPAEPPAPEPR